MIDRLEGLSREELCEIIREVEGLATEAVSVYQPLNLAHTETCHTQFTACLGEAVLEVVEDKVALVRARGIVSRVLGSREDSLL